jgi:hypothetical protein
MIPRRATFLLALATTVLAGCGRNGTPPPAARIGPGGGTVRVTSGPLAGTAITIPPGALEVGITLIVREDTALELPGFAATGPAVRFDPVGTPLKVRATIALPDLVADRAHLRKVVVRDAASGVREAFPVADSQTWQIDELGTCQWVRHAPGMAFPFADFLPYQVDDLWDFDNRFLLAVVDASREPNLPPREVLSLYGAYRVPGGLPNANSNEGRYWIPDGTGALRGLGQWLRTPFFDAGLQQVVARDSYDLFPATLPAATATTTVSDVEFVADAFGALPRTGLACRSQVLVSPRAPLTVPLGTFPDVLPVEVRTLIDGTLWLDRYWLAWRVGIVRYERSFGLVGSGSLVSAVIGGQPVKAR